MISQPQFQFIDTGLINTFLGLDNILKLPILNVGNRTRNYLDYVKPEELTYPIMRGHDIFKRNFIAFRLRCVIEHMSFNIVIVLFQRYVNDTDWVGVSNPCGYQSLLWNPDHKILYDRLEQLILDKKILGIYHPYHEKMINYILT